MSKLVSAAGAMALAAALVVPTVSRAADSTSVTVSYADLNLASTAGQTVLKGRIVNAAKLVCGTASARDLAMARATGECRSDALAGAQPAYDAAVAAARRPSVTVIGAASLVVSAG